MTTFAEWNLLDCADCDLEPSSAYLDVAEPRACPRCGKRVAVYMFPAVLVQGAAKPAVDMTRLEDESSCFYHDAKKATVICEGCGRFLCDLCDIDFQGRHVCSSCVESRPSEDTKPAAQTRHVHYDSIALLLAFGGLLFWPVSFITAGVALYFVFRYWRTPMSVVRRNRWRFVLAALASMGILALWLFLIWLLSGFSLS